MRMRIMSFKSNLSRIISILGIFCLIYAVFFCGYSFGLGQAEQMLRYQAKVSYPEINFSGGFSYGYMDMFMRFCFISVCFFLFILITRTKKRILLEIFALILVLLAIYQIVIVIFYTGPGYLPGQNTNYPAKLLQTLLYLDFLFLGVGIILAILQVVTIWQTYKIHNPIQKGNNHS